VSHSHSAKKQPSDNKPYKCSHCSYTPRRRYNLTTHMMAHDSSRVKGFKCPECGKFFNRKYDKNRHVATVHKKRKAYQCQSCPAQFSRADTLAKHIEKHG
jgi:KRAB domain-containing zinc finger protein